LPREKTVESAVLLRAHDLLQAEDRHESRLVVLLGAEWISLVELLVSLDFDETLAEGHVALSLELVADFDDVLLCFRDGPVEVETEEPLPWADAARR
jgi:hypothetical protein